MKVRHHNKRKRLRFIPLIAGVYGLILGLGLTVIGIADLAESVAGISPGGMGVVRCIVGFALVSFGLYGIWDGIRDLVKPQRDAGWIQTNQFILTDAEGRRSSSVSREVLREQLIALAKKEEDADISLQILPPVWIQGVGRLIQISYLYGEFPRLVAFFESTDGGYTIRQKEADLSLAEVFMEQFLIGSPDFSYWEEGTMTVHPGHTEGGAGRYLRIFGESWHDEHRFFSARDLELAVEGLSGGKYKCVELGLKGASFRIFSDEEEKEIIIMQIYFEEESGFRSLIKKGTMTQVKFWLVKIFHEGLREVIAAW